MQQGRGKSEVVLCRERLRQCFTSRCRGASEAPFRWRVGRAQTGTGGPKEHCREILGSGRSQDHVVRERDAKQWVTDPGKGPRPWETMVPGPEPKVRRVGRASGREVFGSSDLGIELSLDRLAGRALLTALYSGIRKGQGASSALFYLAKRRRTRLQRAGAGPDSKTFWGKRWSLSKMSPGAGLPGLKRSTRTELLLPGVERPGERSIAHCRFTFVTIARSLCRRKAYPQL